jgi:Protein of unknown function (DUF3455)
MMAMEVSMIGRLSWAAVIAFPLLAGAAVSAAAKDAVPAELQPVGYTRLFSSEAKGVQIYTSIAEVGSPPKWVLKAPLAQLNDHQGKLTIYHFAGPSWIAADGSKIVQDADTPAKFVAAPDARANIPWLLIKVTADPAAGALSKIGFVQRILTHGGTAPTTPPLRAGIDVGVPYTATYVFYTKRPPGL